MFIKICQPLYLKSTMSHRDGSDDFSVSYNERGSTWQLWFGSAWMYWRVAVTFSYLATMVWVCLNVLVRGRLLLLPGNYGLGLLECIGAWQWPSPTWQLWFVSAWMYWRVAATFSYLATMVWVCLNVLARGSDLLLPDNYGLGLLECIGAWRLPSPTWQLWFGSAWMYWRVAETFSCSRSTIPSSSWGEARQCYQS